jgi:DNA (cytosine-5)-methyltransferase 1
MHYAYYNEFDPGAAEWLRELMKGGHIMPGVVDERSIIDVAPEDLDGFTQCHFFAGVGGWSLALRMYGWPDNRPVWTGSPPCQPFSVAGQDKGKDDDRHLAPKFISLVGSARPAVLFGEQVASAAVFGKAAKPSKRSGAAGPEWAWFDDLSDRLEASHYAVGALDIPAAGIGAPHIRQRTFFGAYDLRFIGGLVDGIGPRLEGYAGNVCDRNEPGRDDAQPSGPVGAASGFGGLGVADGKTVRGIAGIQSGTKEAGEHRAHPDNVSGSSDVVGRSGPLNGVWANADWLLCRDDKWRPVEPGTFPLAHGLSERVGLLRGYGNAIVPQAAVEAIRTFEIASRGLCRVA